MWRSVLQKIVGWNKQHTVAAVKITCQGNGNTYSALLLHEKKGIISIGETIDQTESLGEIIAKIPATTPIAISLTGRGILHKILQVKPHQEDSLASLVLPNAKNEDYYIQKIPCGNDYVVSMIRRSQLQEAIELLVHHKLTVVSASLGPFAVTSIFPLIAENEILTGQFLIRKEEGELQHFEPSKAISKSINVGNELISSHHIVLFANAFQFLRSEFAQHYLTVPSVTKDKENYFQKQYFIFFGWAIMVFFLLVLLVNFIFFSFYDGKNKELSQNELSASGNLSIINTLSKELTDKEQFLETAGWMGQSSSSFYADRIAATLPMQVQLREIKIHPTDEVESRKLKKNIFQPNMIWLSGTTVASTVLTTWIKELSSIDGIESAQIKKYAHDDKTNTGVFEILITHKE